MGTTLDDASTEDTLSTSVGISLFLLVSFVVAAFPVTALPSQTSPLTLADGEIGVCPWLASPGPDVPSPGPGYDDTSEFFVGSVALGIFLAESTGHAYDWSDAEVSQTLEGIYGALSWWASEEPKANLSFTYELHIRVPVSSEPIENPLADAHIWINEVMGDLGYNRGDARARALEYNNDLRDHMGTDWAFSVFVADSDDEVNLGRFTDDQYACGYVGGPSFTMSRFSSWAFNSADYYRVVPAHETGHMFYATDEYDAGPVEFSGYLRCPDDNGALGIMNHNTLTVSESTRCQVGWRDSDEDGILDVLDIPPETTLHSYVVDETDESRRRYAGTATVVAQHNLNPRGPSNDVTISRIVGVEFRVDDGPWISAEADDEAFDEPVEFFSLTTPPMDTGFYAIEARAWDSEGEVDPTPAQAVPSLGDVDPTQVYVWILEASLSVAVAVIILLAMIRHRRRERPALNRSNNTG